VAAIPRESRPRYQLWIRVDSAGFSAAVVEAAARHSAAFSITCIQNAAVRRAIETLARDEHTTWAPAVEVEHHHRLRAGAPEEAIRQLKWDFGMNHAPVKDFFGNWVWWLASALTYDVARWVRVLALAESLRTCRTSDCG